MHDLHALKVECIRDEKKLRTLEHDLCRLSHGAVMQRPSWLMPWWEAYQSHYQLHGLVAYRDGLVCGIFPLVETTLALTGRSLVLMGSGKACSDDLGILVRTDDAKEVATAFAEWLVHSPDCSRWDHLNLDGIRDSNLAMSWFASSIEEQSGTQFEHKSSPNCWATSLSGGLEEYKARLTKRARKIFREAEAAVDSCKGVFDIATSIPTALAYVDEIERMHQARWQERGIEGCFATREFSCFLRGAVVRMWDDPWEPYVVTSQGSHQVSAEQSQRVQVGLLRINGSVAAGAICFRDRDALAMYLVGMNPDFAEDRPGWMLNTCFIKHAIAMGCKRLDFLRGDEEYKERLGAVPTPQHRWLLPSQRLSSQLRNVAYRTAVGVKEWWLQKTQES